MKNFFSKLGVGFGCGETGGEVCAPTAPENKIRPTKQKDQRAENLARCESTLMGTIHIIFILRNLLISLSRAAFYLFL